MVSALSILNSIVGLGAGLRCGGLRNPGLGCNSMKMFCLRKTCKRIARPSRISRIGQTGCRLRLATTVSRVNVIRSAGLYDVTVKSGGAAGNQFAPAGGGQTSATSNAKRVSVKIGNLTLSIQSSTATGSPTTLSSGSCAYIDEYANMPTIIASLKDTQGNQVQPTTWELRVSDSYYYRDCDNCSAYIKSNNWRAGPNTNSSTTEPWKPTFSEVRGGRAELIYTYLGLQYPSFNFKICGKNPNPADVVSAFSSPSPLQNQYWMAPLIATHETNQSQFCEQTRMQAAWCATQKNWGFPIWGEPAGYGLGQLDPIPSTSVLWNWRENASAYMTFLDKKAGPNEDTSDANGTSKDQRAYPFWIRQAKQFYRYNARVPKNQQVAEPNPQIEGTLPNSCKFVFSAQVAPFYTTPVTGQAGTYWFADAILMRMVGGGTPHYISLSTTLVPEWLWSKKSTIRLNNGTIQEHNFAYEYCTCVTTQTCEHQTPANKLGPQ